jgi:tetratricopeptide (TPR) repeat protein
MAAGGEALYERYKEALKRGHVASLKGRLDEALDAYAEASRIAPERATPHISAGTALLRRKRPADALRYFDAALTLAPRDETALVGRAQSLAVLDRRREAAEAYDKLAEHRAVNGKLADAVDASRRALELAEGRERRRTLERLIERLRASNPGDAGRVALEKAMRVLDGPAVVEAPAPPVQAPGSEDLTAAELAAIVGAVAAVGDQAADEAPVEGLEAVASAEVADAVPAEVAAVEAGEPAEAVADEATEDAEASIEAGAEAAAEPEPEPEPVVILPGALDRALPEGVAVDELARRAEATLDAGDPDEAVERLLDLATAYRLTGTRDAAIDACYLALSFDPDHVGLHLALVQLYDDNGWSALATDKLDLLDRLVALGEDADGAGRVASARATRA